MALTFYTAPTDTAAKRPAARVTQLPVFGRCKIAILGFGTVGRSVAKVLAGNQHRSLELTHIYNREVERKRELWVDDRVQWTDNYESVLASDAQIVVELLGGLEPARAYVRQALLAGKSVVTANKHLIATYGVELLALARQMNVRLEYGASVAGGVPVICAIQQGLAGDQLTKLCGVLNGTCNFILSNMERRGVGFPDALAQAQKLGFAEANPSDDVNGFDAICKLAILSRIAFKIQLQPEQIAATPIARIQLSDFAAAKSIGFTIRQVSQAELNGGSLGAFVGPALVRLGSPLAQTYDNQNALITSGKHGMETVFSGRGAGGGPTAVAVVSDLMSLASDRLSNSNPVVDEELSRVSVGSDFPLSRYLRLSNACRKPLSALVRGLCRKHGLSVQPIARHDRAASKERVAFAISECTTATTEGLLNELREHDCSFDPLLLPILP